MIIIAGDEYVEKITALLVENGYFATNIGRSGDFLQYGSTVLMLGIEEQRVDDVFDLLKGDASSNQKEGNYCDEVSIYVVDVEKDLKVNRIPETSEVSSI